MRKNFCFRAMASCVNTLKPGVKYNQKRKAFGLPLFHSRICRISQIARLYRVRGRGRRVLFGRVRFPSAPHAALRCVCSSAAPPCQRQNVLRRVQQKIRRRAVLHAAQKLLGEALLHPPRDGPAQAARAGGRLVCLTHQQPRGGGRVRQADALLRGARFQLPQQRFPNGHKVLLRQRA